MLIIQAKERNRDQEDNGLTADEYFEMLYGNVPIAFEGETDKESSSLENQKE